MATKKKPKVVRAPESALPSEVPVPADATFMGEPWSIDQLDPAPGGASSRGPHRRLAVDTCETLAALRYFIDVRPKNQKKFTAQGSLFHLDAAYHYGRRTPRPPRWWKDRDFEKDQLDIIRSFNSDERRQLQEESKKRFLAYKKHYSGESLIPLFVEREFVATIGELPGGGSDDISKEILSARGDLCALQHGQIVGVDYKTKGENPYRRGDLPWHDEEEYERERQVLENCGILSARFGKPVNRFMIRRVKREWPFAFEDNPVDVDLRALERLGARARATVKKEFQIAEKVDAGKKLKMDGLDRNACCGKYGPCDYWSVCRSVTQDDRIDVLTNDFGANTKQVSKILRVLQ